MDEASGDNRAQLARPCADGLAFIEIKERRQGAARLDAAGRYELRDIEDVDGRKAGVLGLGRVDPRQRGVGRSEVYSDFHTVSRTLNSSFQRRWSLATHQSWSMPVSVMTVSNETGTSSDVLPSEVR